MTHFFINERGEYEYRNVKEIDLDKLLENAPEIKLSEVLALAEATEGELKVDLKGREYCLSRGFRR